MLINSLEIPSKSTARVIDKAKKFCHSVNLEHWKQSGSIKKKKKKKDWGIKNRLGEGNVLKRLKIIFSFYLNYGLFQL